jgi:hemerythrin-like domain-containing protein
MTHMEAAMKATEILIEEHELILKMLDIIEVINHKIENGQHVDVAHLEGIVDFIVNFADRCHHAKEEGILFPAMVRAGIPEKQGPIGVMLHEHVEGREYVRAMKKALAGSPANGTGVLHEFARSAAGYAELLRNHIYKENNILFRMADDRIGPAGQKEILEAFERVERDEIGEGVHEKYHEMAHKLAENYLR